MCMAYYNSILLDADHYSHSSQVGGSNKKEVLRVFFFFLIIISGGQAENLASSV